MKRFVVYSTIIILIVTTLACTTPWMEQSSLEVETHAPPTASIDTPRPLLERLTPREFRPLVSMVSQAVTTFQPNVIEDESIGASSLYLGDELNLAALTVSSVETVPAETIAPAAIHLNQASDTLALPSLEPVNNTLIIQPVHVESNPSQLIATPVISPTAPSMTATIGMVRPRNILLIGADKRPGGNAGRSDTVIVMRVNPISKTVTMLSLPRDLWVSIPNYNRKHRLNAAYLLGETRTPNGGGVTLLKETLSYNFGIEIDDYAQINFDGFERVVDTLGGIELDVPETLDTARYYGFTPRYIYRDRHYSFIPADTVDAEGKPLVSAMSLISQTVTINNDAALQPFADELGYRMLYVEAGRHTFSGETALQYARSRASTTADFARMQRQQAVLLAIRAKALQTQQLIHVPQLWSNLQDAIQTDLTILDILELARLAHEIQPEQIRNVTIDYTMTEDYTSDKGARVLRPLYDKINPVLMELFEIDPQNLKGDMLNEE